jgi:hypothetical protein
MKVKFAVISMFALLAFLLFLLPQQTLADEDVHYVYPTIETNCDQINATAYRFHPGNTLNLTFTFTTSRPVYAYFQKNYTWNVEGEYPLGYVTATDFARFYWFEWFDGIGGPGHNEGFMLASDGEDMGSWQMGFPEVGEHTIKIVYLFKGYGDYKGFFELKFLSEPKLTLEEMNSPMPTIPILIGGVSGAGIAFAITAVIWHKKNSKKEENDVNP